MRRIDALFVALLLTLLTPVAFGKGKPSTGGTTGTIVTIDDTACGAFGISNDARGDYVSWELPDPAPPSNHCVGANGGTMHLNRKYSDGTFCAEEMAAQGVPLSALRSYTLRFPDAALPDGRSLCAVAGGALSGACVLTLPNDTTDFVRIWSYKPKGPRAGQRLQFTIPNKAAPDGSDYAITIETEDELLVTTDSSGVTHYSHAGNASIWIDAGWNTATKLGDSFCFPVSIHTETIAIP